MKLFAPLAAFALVACGSGSDFAGSGAKASPKPPAATPARAPQSDDATGAEAPATRPPATTVPAQDPPAQATDDAPDLPAEAPSDDPNASVDAACASNASGGGIFGGIGVPVSAPSPFLPRTLPLDCRQGIEFNNYKGSFDLTASAVEARSLKLEVDVATYEAPDRMKVIAITDTGARTIFDTCRLKTSSYLDPTGGASRPPPDSIRSFRPVLPKGTRALRFDFTGTHTPSYFRLNGLCDFSLAPAGVDPGARTVY